ncbi:MAG: TrkH family potassium uptake protein, partial [Syntrophobacteraceae bacterium]
NLSVVDAFFTTTSAGCVTGLTVVDTGTAFSLAGQLIILILIQLGGLGIMTFSVVLFLSIGKRVSFRQRLIMQEVFAHTPREDIYKVVRGIVIFTAAIEGAGIVSLLFFWLHEFSFSKALHMAVFHSISAFCNAGFSLFSNNFINYSASPWLNLTISILIILGGIGFPVVYELYDKLTSSKTNRSRISIQTKLVLLVSTLFIISGTLVILWCEYGRYPSSVSTLERFWNAFFQSVTSRTAGFNTVDIGGLSSPALAFMLFLMFWGASPGSCGGGVKTTTLAVLASLTWNRLCGRSKVNLFKRSIPEGTVSKSLTLFALSMALILTIHFLLLLTQGEPSAGEYPKGEFLEYLFETISAFGTVGLSMGVTAKLNTIGKLLIILMMLIGRVGVLTFAYLLAGADARGGVQHAEQNVMIG